MNEITQKHIDAITLAGWGFKIGPLDGKAPITPNGFKDFTNDISQVDKWWYYHPTANIGARVFKGHVVIDIDPRNGGDETWRKLNHDKQLPDTLTTRTGSGGLHLWYRMPHAGEVRGTAGPGIDIKTEKGYLVMPGSTHPETGGLYVCEKWAQPAELPAWLVKHVYRIETRPVKPSTPREGNGAGLINAVAGAQPGERNSTLYWAACRANTEGLDLEHELAEAAQSIGLSNAEITATLRSAKAVA